MPGLGDVKVLAIVSALIAILVFLVIAIRAIYRAGKDKGIKEGIDAANTKTIEAEKHLAEDLSNPDPNNALGRVRDPSGWTKGITPKK